MNIKLPKLDKQTREKYISDYNEKAIPYFRLAIIFTLIASFPYAYLDLSLIPNNLYFVWIIRFTIWIPILILAFISSYYPIYIKYSQIITSISILIMGFGIEAMIAVSDKSELAFTMYYVGVILIMFGTILMRLRLKATVITVSLLSIGYVFVAVYFQNMLSSTPSSNYPIIFLNNIFFLFTFALVIMLSSYIMESYSLNNFIQKQIIIEEQLLVKEKTEQQQILIDNLPAHIYFKDKKLRYVLVNKSFAKLVNLESKGILGKTDEEISPKNIAEIHKKLDFEIVNSEKTKVIFEETHTDISGKKYWALTSKIPYFDSKRNIDGIIGIVLDITDRKNAEQEITSQKEAIEKAHKGITDSINYAKTIQDSLLPNSKLIDTFLDNYFILFKPKEHVSGDFYYVNKIDDYLIFAAADCTGHGVPGAFLTMLGITYLHEIVSLEGVCSPGEALNDLRKHFKKTFNDFGSENNNGLDIALCAVNTKTNILEYAGAYNPLLIIRDNKIIEYKATRNPIGIYPKEKQFKNHKIELKNNDLLYVFSDGFQDQFGGDDNRKFTKKRFYKMLLELHILPLKEQKNRLLQTLNEWKGNLEQIDDITIMGIKWNEQTK